MAKKTAPKAKVKKATKKAVSTKKAAKKVAVKKSPAKKSIAKKVAVKKAVKKTLVSKPKTGYPELVHLIIEGMQEKKAKNITLLDLRSLENRVCDFFIICDGDSKTHVSAIGDSVHYEVKKRSGELPYHSEGYENAEWILLDYVNVVAHVFQRPVREFYNLEALWADAESKTFE